MFCRAVIGALQAGQADRGTTRLNGPLLSGAGVLWSSAHCARHWRSRMMGSRQMTTFRKLPTSSPSTRQVPMNRPAEAASSSRTDIFRAPKENAARARGVVRLNSVRASADDRTQLEDGQVH